MTSSSKRPACSLRAGIIAGIAAGALVSLYQYLIPLNYITVAKLAPLFAVNCGVCVVVGALCSLLWCRFARFGTLLMVLTVALAAWAWGHWNLRREFNVVLYVSDAVRADHLSVFGYDRDTTPTLELLASDPNVVLFRQAISQGTCTWGGTPALLASSYPSMNGILRFQQGLSDMTTTVVEALHDAGYKTMGISANPHITRAKNFDQGFDVFEDCIKWAESPEADRVNRLYLHWQKQPANRDRHFAFLFVIDNHGPYAADKEEVRRYRPQFDLPWTPPRELYRTKDESIRQDMVAMYDASVRFVDQQLGVLIEGLRRSGQFDRTVFIFTSDHGEAWWEHGKAEHGGTPYEEVIRIPLVIHLPSPVRFPAIRPVETQPEWQVGQVDIAPTLLALTRVEADIPAMRGRNLLPYLYGKVEPPVGRGMLSEIQSARTLIRCWRRLPWKYIVTHNESPTGEGQPDKEELFDLAQDPGETTNIAAAHAEQLQRCREELAAEAAAAKAYEVAAQPADLSPEAVRRLKAMGYLK